MGASAVPPASAINSMSKISKTQASADVSMQESCCRTLMRVLQNVESSPKDPKFRQLNRENKALASKVFAVPGAEEFLMAVGWQSPPGCHVMSLPEEVPLAKIRTSIAKLQEHMGRLPQKPVLDTSGTAPSGPAYPSDWSCAACTLTNGGSRALCEACGNPR